MSISSNQVHNVLRTYGKQLRRGLRLNRVKAFEPGVTTTDKVNISSEAKRKQVVERVASEIMFRLTDPTGTRGTMENEIMAKLSEEYGQTLSVNFDSSTNRLLFYATASDQEGAVKKLDNEQAARLERRLMEITTQMVDQTML